MENETKEGIALKDASACRRIQSGFKQGCIHRLADRMLTQLKETSRK
jgi:hypothetical protein